MKRKWTLVGSVVFSSVIAWQACANPVPIGSNQRVPEDRGMQYVQEVSLPALAPSSLRRMMFYSDKTIIALFDLANEDLLAGQNGGIISDETTKALRAAIVRLIEAGAKADLDVDQVALFFAQEAEVRFSGPLPIVLQDANGKLDAQTLFRGVAITNIKVNTPAAEADYLAALSDEVASLSPNSETGEVQVVEEEPRDPALQAIMDRARMVDGKRIIEVQAGDTLAAFAQAFYNDTLSYRVIYNANTDTLRNPNALDIGQVLTIPEG